jgi:hypothetical protein
MWPITSKDDVQEYITSAYHDTKLYFCKIDNVYHMICWCARSVGPFELAYDSFAFKGVDPCVVGAFGGANCGFES